MNRLRFATMLAIGALACIAQGSLGRAHAAPAATPTQLPRSVRPVSYEVSLEPNAEAMSFRAHVTIAIEVLRPTQTITLNAADLEFDAARLAGAGAGAATPTTAIEVNAGEQTATFRFAAAIPRGSYRLSIDYRGKIGTQAVGLFAIDDQTAGGRERSLYTQFENSDARRMIPSWDEPAYKATFALEATVPAAASTVSNMPMAERAELGDGRARVRFAVTPIMSTYLLFFAMGNFERIADQIDGIDIGVITRKGVASQGAFALASAKAVLHEYNAYFGIPYPLPKLDNVAAPGTSEFFSAMENWGAIFTFERDMLLDPLIATQADTEDVFTTAAHEIAHQWFGDLVTMRWWDDLWLNEGFASWMESRTTARLHPEWNTALAAVDIRDAAMSRDALATTHPIVQPIATVDQASQAFDEITYAKGEAVIRMLESYVGDEAWRTGVQHYLRDHAYGNTVSDDLWRAMEHATGRPIRAVAHDFTLQPGVPLIRVEGTVCRNGQTVLKLSQGEFTRLPVTRAPRHWRVPVVVAARGGAPVRALVSGTGTVSVAGCGEVILVNAGQSGYYRTLYAADQFKGVAAQFAAIPAIDQLGILSDTWALGAAGLSPLTDALDLVRETPASADPQVLGAIATILGAINDYYAAEPAERRAAFREFAIARLAPLFASVGWAARPGESTSLANLRNTLIATLSALDAPAVIAEARRRYAADGIDPAAVPAPIRRTLLRVVARHADAAAWDQLHAKALAEKTPLVRDFLYEILASTEDDALAGRALDLAMTDEPGATISAVMIRQVSVLHPEMAFDFALARQAAVLARVDASSRSRYFAFLAEHSLDPAMSGRIHAYAVANLPAASRQEADAAAAIIAYRVRVRTQGLPLIEAWIAQLQHG